MQMGRACQLFSSVNLVMAADRYAPTPQKVGMVMLIRPQRIPSRNEMPSTALQIEMMATF